jgi:multidrug efflux pump subunit AcrA (membrane-fusion protein)
MRKVIWIGFAVAVYLCGGYAWTHVHAATTPTERKVLYWVDPMHPSYKSNKPGIAPDCGMKLEPVYEERRKETGSQGSGLVHVSSEMEQAIGLQYGTASYTTERETIRAPGRIVPDETRIARVYPHMEGWISKTFVDFNGQMVKKGDLLLTINSPEVVAAEQEFLLALDTRDHMKASAVKEAWDDSELLVQSTRKRLEVFDLTPAQVAEIEETRSPLNGGAMLELFDKKQAAGDGHTPGTVRTISVFSPASGYVTGRNAFPSQRVTPDTELYTLSDLSHVWIMADVSAADIGCIHQGQSAVVTSPNSEVPSFSARVSYIQPQVDPQTRTAKVRLEASNDRVRLKPDMFVNVEFSLGAARKLTVPRDAVMDSGTKQTVYVDCGKGNLEPRKVQIGQRMGERVEILAGLRHGERIVTSATFLIDSESRLRTGMAGSGIAGDHD